MTDNFTSLASKSKLVSIFELKRLLHRIYDSKSEICIRFRLIGEMWQLHHSRIIGLSDNGAALCDENTRQLFLIADLKHVVQFELDERFEIYEPNCHYDIDPVTALN